MAKRLEHILEWGFAQDFQILVEIYLYFLNSISCWAEKPKWNEMKWKRVLGLRIEPIKKS